MALTNPTIRPINQGDIIDIYGHTLPYSVRGIAATIDGELVGATGVLYSNPLQCFSSVSERLRKSPRTIVKAVRLIREILDSYTAPVYAIPDENEPTALGFLKHVGFIKLPDGRHVYGRSD